MSNMPEQDGRGRGPQQGSIVLALVIVFVVSWVLLAAAVDPEAAIGIRKVLDGAANVLAAARG